MMKKITMVAMAALIAVMTASAGVIFTDDFEADPVANPMANPTLGGWTTDPNLTGNADGVLDGAEGRIFQAPAGSAQLNSRGWICLEANSYVYKDLGTLTANTNYWATVFIDAETFNPESYVDYQIEFLVGADIGSATQESQTQGSEAGGADGKQPDEYKTLSLDTTGMSATDHVYLQIRLLSGSAWMFADDVEVIISEEYVAPTYLPVISSFTASDTAVQSNDTVTLSWVTTNAVSLTLEPGTLDVTGLSSNDVVITSNITYSLIAANTAGSVTSTVDIIVVPDAPDVTMLWRRDWEQLGHNAEVDNNNLDGGPVSSVEVGSQDFTLSGGTLRTFDSADVGGFDLISTVNVDPFDAIIEITDVQYAAGVEHTLEFVIGTGASSGLDGAWIVEYGTMSDGTFTVLPSVDAGSATYSYDTAADAPLNEDENFQDDTNFSALFGYNVGGRTQTLVVDAPDSVNGQNVAVRIVVTASANWAGYTDMALYSTSNPLEPVGNIAISNLASGDVAITWDTASGQAYDVNTNANLVVPNWGILDSVIGTGGSVSVTSATDQVELFYTVTSE